MTILSLHVVLTLLLPFLLARRNVAVSAIFISLLANLGVQIRLHYRDEEGLIFAIGCVLVLTSAMFTLIFKAVRKFVDDAGRQLLELENHNT